MGLPYISTFHVTVPENDSGINRLQSFLQSELSGYSGGSSTDIEVESDSIADFGYALLTCERPHPRMPEQQLQLEMRLCEAAGEPVSANIRCRFITADGEDPPDLRAGPPRLVATMAERFSCFIDGAELALKPATIHADSVESFLQREVFNWDRSLPLLVISEDDDGNVLLDPVRAQRELLGLARVVRIPHNATEKYRQQVHHTLVTYGGAARWLWPGAHSEGNGPGTAPHYYGQEVLSREANSNAFLYALQQKALEYHYRSGQPSEFDSIFSQCRMEVLLSRNRQLEAQGIQQQGPPDRETSRELRKEQVRANELNRRLSTEQARVARMDQELAEAQRRVVELEAGANSGGDDSTGVSAGNQRRAIRDLQETLKSRNDTIDRLNDELQQYRQRERVGSHAFGQWEEAVREKMVLPLTDTRLRRLTLCNHALNLYRDPMRQFITSNLIQECGPDLRRWLQASVKDFDPNSSYNPEQPGSSIDIGDFEYLVRDYGFHLPENCPDHGQLGDIRRFRNKVVHPPMEGLDIVTARDGLRTICGVLSQIGEMAAVNEIIALNWLIGDAPQAAPD